MWTEGRAKLDVSGATLDFLNTQIGKIVNLLSLIALLLFTHSAAASGEPDVDSAPETSSNSGVLSDGNPDAEGRFAEEECTRFAEAQAQKERDERMSKEWDRLKAEADKLWGDLQPQLSSCAGQSDSSQRRVCAVKLSEFHDWVTDFQVSESADTVDIKTTEFCGPRSVALKSSVVTVNHIGPNLWGNLLSEVDGMARKLNVSDVIFGLSVEWSQLEIKSQVGPVFPKAAGNSRSAGDHQCSARVAIDENGVPTRIVVSSCPEVFHQSTVDAVMQWRWVPFQLDQRKIKVETTYMVRYILR